MNRNRHNATENSSSHAGKDAATPTGLSRRAFVGALGALVTHSAINPGPASADSPASHSASSLKPPDSDAQRVTTKFAAAAKLSPEQTALLLQFTRALEESGIYTKLLAVYPFLGASVASMALNLLDPADEEGAFRLSYTGTPTAGPKGIAWAEGSKGNTQIDYALITGAPSVGAAYYVQSGISGTIIGNGDSGFALVQRDPNNGKAYIQIAASAEGIAYSGDSLAGFWAMQRTGAAAKNLELYHDGRLLGTDTRAINSLFSTGPIVLNPQGVVHVMSYAAIGQALTAREQEAHHAAVNTLLGRLGRTV